MGWSASVKDQSKLSGAGDLLISSLNQKGIVYSIRDYDSAFFCFNEAMLLSEKSNIDDDRSSILYNMAQLHYTVNDFKQCIILLDSSIRMGVRKKNFGTATSSMNLLGIIHLLTDDENTARLLFDSAYKVAASHALSHEMAVSLSNMSRYMNNPDSAKNVLQESLSLLRKLEGTEEEQANTEINLGLLQQNSDSARVNFQRVIEMATRYNMSVELMGACNNLAYVYLKEREFARAEMVMLEIAIPKAVQTQNIDWLSTLYDTYADVLLAKHQFGEAYNYLRKSIVARAASDEKNSEKQIRLLNAIMDVKNKNLLILEKEQVIDQQDAAIARMSIWILILGVILLTTGTFVFWFRQRGKMALQRSQVEAAKMLIEAEEREKERNAMEIHDAVGALRVKIRKSLGSFKRSDDRCTIVIEDHLHDFYLEIRNLSHRMNKNILERHPFDLLLKALCDEYSSSNILNLSYKIDPVPCQLPVDMTIHMYRIIQELLNNARKHAPDASILLEVHISNQNIDIIYSDNGQGFELKEVQEKGMGLTNIFTRVKLINGCAEIDSAPGHGVFWKISVPAVCT